MNHDEERVKLYQDIVRQREEREGKLNLITNNPPDPGVYEHLSRIEKYQVEVERCMTIFEERNAIYKDTFVFLGLLGTTTTLIGDIYRLRNMIYQNPSHGREYYELIEDKLIDVVNQAVISLMMLHEDNWEGK